MDILNHWFSRVQQIITQRQKVAAITGDNFNIFRILSLESSEVRLHSALIAELLDPSGSHGQADLFLKLFVDIFEITGYDTKSSKSEIEKHIGFVDSDRTSGGRIDIVLTDKDNNQIFIENKIYASDADNQLLRYYNFNSKAHLIYLTLDGCQASETSTGGILSHDSYKKLSYESDIVRWLIECRNKSSCLPFIRETISQYIILLKILTNQAEYDAMNKEIKDFIIDNPTFVESIEKCYHILSEIVNEAYQLFRDKMDNHFKRHEIVTTIDNLTILCKWSEDGDGVHYGYLLYDGETNISNNSMSKKYTEILKEINDDFHAGGWLGWKNAPGFTRYKRFSGLNKDIIIDMYKNREFLDDFVANIVDEEQAIRKLFIEKIKNTATT